MTVTVTSDFLVAQLPNVNPPFPRVGATGTTIGSDFYIFGGENIGSGLFVADIFWQYSLTTQTWTQITASNGPSQRIFPGFASVGQNLYILGGQSSLQDASLWQYNTVSDIWTQLLPNVPYPNIPQALTCTAFNNNLFVFGGQDQSDNFYNQMYKFNTVTDTWTSVSTSGGPPAPRAYHSAVAIGSNIFIFGGISDFTVFNDLWKFNTSNSTWQQLSSGPSRVSHSAVVVGSDMFIFGGDNSTSNSPNNNIWQYDSASDLWTEINLINGPSPRSAHAATAIDGNMLIFGGEDINGNTLGDLWDIYLLPITLQLSDHLSSNTVPINTPYTIFWNLSITNPPLFGSTITIQKPPGFLLIPPSDQNIGSSQEFSPSEIGVYPVTITATISVFNLTISDTLSLTVGNIQFFLSDITLSPTSISVDQPYQITWTLFTNTGDVNVIVQAPDNPLFSADYRDQQSGSTKFYAPSVSSDYFITLIASDEAGNSDIHTIPLSVQKEFIFESFQPASPVGPGQPVVLNWKIQDNSPPLNYKIKILRSDGTPLLNPTNSIDPSGSVSDTAPLAPGSYPYTAIAYSNTYPDFSDQITTMLQVTQVQLTNVTVTDPVLTGQPYQISWEPIISNNQTGETVTVKVQAPGNTLIGNYTNTQTGTIKFTAPSVASDSYPITLTASDQYGSSDSKTVFFAVVNNFAFQSFQLTPSPTAPGKPVILNWKIQDSLNSPNYTIKILRSDNTILLPPTPYTTATGSISDTAPPDAGNYQYTAFAVDNTFSFSDQAHVLLQVTQVHLSDINITSNPSLIGDPYQISWTVLMDNNQSGETAQVTVLAPETEFPFISDFSASYQNAHIGTATFITPTIASDYTILLFASDQYGSIDTETVILSTKNLTVNAGSDQTITYGSSTTIGSGTPDPNVTYTWTPPDTLNHPNTLTPTARPLITTTYTLVAYRSDINRYKSDSVTVTVIAPISFSSVTLTPNTVDISNPQPVKISWTITPAFPTPNYTITIRNSETNLNFQSDYFNVLSGFIMDTPPNVTSVSTYQLTVIRKDYGNLSGSGSVALTTISEIQPKPSSTTPTTTPTKNKSSLPPPYFITLLLALCGGAMFFLISMFF